eukprot:TRINITY_DN155_c0_g1_i2.p1 TRINITY_DN155_c0_g1~~TRINITY_DN155_c0_g1_i2.p1  ORF type:complete len:273 (+),score=49.77 TRINITY_DN155_c0_g1_i2:41-859(+)
MMAEALLSSSSSSLSLPSRHSTGSRPFHSSSVLACARLAPQRRKVAPLKGVKYSVFRARIYFKDTNPKQRSRGPAAAITASLTIGEGESSDSAIHHHPVDLLTVGDVMTEGKLVTATPWTSIDEALEALVDNRVTGMPVVDEEGKLIGVVSDYDLLALDAISGKRPASETGLFPQTDRTWKAFREVQKLLVKTHGSTVGDVMTSSPVVVRPSTNLEDAAKLLLELKYRRLPVVDDSGRLVGLITRGNIIKAALDMKKRHHHTFGEEAVQGQI